MNHREKIREFVESNLFDFIGEVYFSDKDNIFQLGLVNSLFAMKLFNFVKTEFNIEIGSDDMEITNFDSINSITKFIERKNN